MQTGRKTKALMVLGTASHVGKSLVVTALCRILHQDGFHVAPFKAQNMALNSFVTRNGYEIGRAQAVQAEAAGIEPHVDMNPILLKPSSDTGAQIVLNGKVYGNVIARDLYQQKSYLLQSVIAAYNRLASFYDFIVLEGAGSPVEMNLKDQDIVNLKMAEIADASCLLVADIDRGGVFASLVGTFELLTSREKTRFAGFLINKFRGDMDLLHPGIEFLEKRLKKPCLGVIPYLYNHGIDEEDSVALEEKVQSSISNPDKLRISVVQLPHISNYTDFAVLESSPEIDLLYAPTPEVIDSCHVLILPGTKNTISDLLWLRNNGFAEKILGHARAGKPVVGICGGFQMLGRAVQDPHHVESRMNVASGLGLLDTVTTLHTEKITRQARAYLFNPEAFEVTFPGPEFQGYEIHMGETTLGPDVQPLFRLTRSGDNRIILDGALSTDCRILGTYLHGLFDSTEAATFLLAYFRRLCGLSQNPQSMFRQRDRQKKYDELANHFRQHMDMKSIYRFMGIDR